MEQKLDLILKKLEKLDIIEAEVNGIKTEVNGIKTEVQELKYEFNDFKDRTKQDIITLTHMITRTQEMIADLDRRQEVTFRSHSGRLHELEYRIEKLENILLPESVQK